MDKNRLLELAGMTPLNEDKGPPTDSNLHPAGTGKKATTGSAGSAPAAKVPADSNLHPAGTGKKQTVGDSKPAAAVPSDSNLHPAGTGKKATTGSGSMNEEVSKLSESIVAKVQALAASLNEGEVKFADYRHDALKRIHEMVSKYVD
jgi:ribosomal protein L31